MNEEKEFKKLKVGINLAIRRAMEKRLSPELIKEALEDCALCQLFNETNFKNNFSNVSNEANSLEKKNEKKTLKIKRFLARNCIHFMQCGIIMVVAANIAALLRNFIVVVPLFYLGLILFLTGSYGDSYLRKRMVMQ